MPVLFEKTKIKGLELKNRLIRSATHEAMADDNGSPTESLFTLYERLAKGGVGMITTGFAFVTRDGKVKDQLGMDNDGLIPKYRDLTNFVHQNGTAIAMQIAHCGRQTIEDYTGSQPIAPSPVKEKAYLVKPKEMTEHDIERIIEAFAQASRRVKEAGFDAVQLHAAHGYLINEFLCPYTNRRKDKWGGSIENRMRFLQEIYHRSREQVGNDYPILVKMSAYDNMKKGLKPEEGVAMAAMMADMGFDGIEVSCGIAEDGFSTLRGKAPIDTILETWPMYKSKNAAFKWVMSRFGEKLLKPVPFTEAFNLESAKEIKRKINIPVFLVGGMINPKTMEEVIERGDADYISLCRPLITDPNFPNKIAEGNKSPSKCLHCNLCIVCVFTEPLRCHYGKWKGSNQIH
jgi:2,4-dienoyl-CoA reductase-like NADH-dependent reductase (Old Yellow Enzyme family)